MRVVEFDSLFQFIRNGMNVKQDKSGKGIPITRIETIANGTVDASRVGFAGLSEADCRDWIMEPGDILFSHINSVEHVGKCAVYRGSPKKLVHGMNLLCLRCDETQLIPDFAKYLISGKDFRSRLSNFINKAVNQASVSIGNLKTIRVSVPCISEQRRIAAILDQADALRAKRREALAQLDSLTQSIFIEMFGHPHFNPKGLPRKRLAHLCERVTVGYVGPMANEYVDSGIPFLRSLNICRGRVEMKDIKFITPQFHARLRKSEIRAGDVVTVRTGQPGTTAVIPESLGVANCADLIVMTCGAELDPTYLCEALNLWLGDAESIQGQVGAIQVHFNIGRAKELELPLPSLADQKLFANRIKVTKELKLLQTESMIGLDALFSSLQHRAFRGEL